MNCLASAPAADHGELEACDVGELFRALSGPLERIVRIDVRAPDSVIEDACQFAWGRLVSNCGRVRRECALSWLATTAVREAVRMVRQERRDVSFDDGPELTLGHVSTPACDELVENRERLKLIRQLPERQQRLLWLRGLGMSYEEMAQYTGCTTRTVERQLLRARLRIRALAAA